MKSIHILAFALFCALCFVATPSLDVVSQDAVELTDRFDDASEDDQLSEYTLDQFTLRYPTQVQSGASSQDCPTLSTPYCAYRSQGPPTFLL